MVKSWPSQSAVEAPKQFAIVTSALVPARLKAALKPRRKSVIEDIESRKEDIERNIASYSSWFDDAGHPCPLASQLERTLSHGLSTISPPIDALMYCEMTTGLLLGVQDLDAVAGELRFDFASDGETFEGFRAPVKCSAGEPVVRDDAGIVASVFQGPDRRTSVGPETSNLLFYVFDSPGLTGAAFDRGVATVMQLMNDADGAPTETRVSAPR